MKEESEKVGLKLNIQKTKIMASGPITSWQIDGETVKTVSDFILGGHFVNRLFAGVVKHIYCTLVHIDVFDEVPQNLI